MYLTGIQHCVLVVLIRSFAHKNIIHNGIRKGSKSEKKHFVFVSVLQ